MRIESVREPVEGSDLQLSARDANDRARRPEPGPLTPLCIAAFALLVRMLPIRGVFAGGEIYFTDSDSYYHLRRIAYNLAQFPRTLEHDPYLNFPVGAKAIWPQTLDWLLAAVLWPVHSIAGERDFERVVVWLPPILGALTVWLLYRIALRHFGARVAIVSSLVLSVLPAHFWYSQIGFLDHHAVVSLCATALLGATLDLVGRCGDDAGGGASLRGGAIAFGGLLAFNLLIWPGALLYVALAEAAIWGSLLASSSVAVRRRALECVFIANLAALVLISPFALGNEWPQWGDFSAVVLSNFQPWMFGFVALHAGASLLLFDRAYAGGVALCLGAAALLAGLLLGGSIGLFPGLMQSAVDSAQWLGRGDSFQAMVGESVPLFTLHGSFTTRIASSRLSYFLYLFPVAMGWLAFEWRRSESRPALYSFIGWSLVLFGFTLLQKRFFNTFSVCLALTMGIALVKCHEVLTQRAVSTRSVRSSIVVIVSLALLWPCLWFYRDSYASDRGGDRRGEINRARREMTNWLRRHTPETSGFLDASEAPEFGVLARWGEGHFITYVARRPAATGNFGDDLGRENFLLARSFFTAAPKEASEILEGLGVRYLVIRSMNESRAMAKKLFDRDGARLGRYRLLYEVPALEGSERPSHKIFEFVRGAELVGHAPPRSLVKAVLALITNLDRATSYEAVAEADAHGRYRLRLPYANLGQVGEIETAERYRIHVGAAMAEIAIDESAVVEGRVVEGPGF